MNITLTTITSNALSVAATAISTTANPTSLFPQPMSLSISPTTGITLIRLLPFKHRIGAPIQLPRLQSPHPVPLRTPHTSGILRWPFDSPGEHDGSHPTDWGRQAQIRFCGFTIMVKPFILLISFLIFIFSLPSFSSSSCLFDLSYVQTFPWDTSTCHSNNGTQCCQTLLSLFGMGLAQHLKDTSVFELPDVNSSSSCLSDFRDQLASMSIDPSLVNTCFQNSTQFVSNSSSCAGIITAKDFTSKVGMMTPLDTSCKGDLSALTLCGVCLDAGMKVSSQLTAIDPNSTKCFYFTVLYASALVNQYGPKDVRSASCILGMPLSTSAEGSKKERILKLTFGLLGGVVGVLLAFGLLLVYRKWDKTRRENIYHRGVVSSVRASVLPYTGAKWFHLSELEKATDKFSQRNLVGQGSDGVVYKGTLRDGTLVAVKEIFDLETKGDEEFCYEVEIISKIKHRNLVALRGCCVTSDNLKGKRRFLVYDYMSNNSLSHQLSLSGANRPLTWPQRKNILLDVAKGLAYLHYEIKPPIYHRDIKANNILLDSTMKAKVADFGLAKQGNEGQSHLTTRVAGTYGYLAPEYALYGQLTDKSDVYSFGIVILEVMSGRKVLDTSNSSVVLITDWAWTHAKSGNIEEILDASIREGGPKRIMERFVLVGILCAHVMVALRPTISEALKMLEGDIDIPNLPDRPVPLGHESFQSSLLYGLQSSGRSTPFSSSVQSFKYEHNIRLPLDHQN
ncbi:putative receptor-like protein kinase [Senna tora]|uniref:non-specific serine/threonine protein kinase n=1 Tax=Senna tora TaxID=362788 RepID=A0A834T6M2_9FABA|nr:putative receptor-like protein kinase [Senna tora]